MALKNVMSHHLAQKISLVFNCRAVMSCIISHQLNDQLPHIQSSSFTLIHRRNTRQYSTKRGRKYVPRRAMMYVPGSDVKKLQKLEQLDVDCACMDCEDGVALNRKTEARETICRMLDELDFGRTEPAVRINSVASGLAEEDLKVIFQAERLPPTIMLPKVDLPDEITWFSDQLEKVLLDRDLKDLEEKINLIIFTESAIGMLSLVDICKEALLLSDAGAPFKLDGVVFGSDDFLADIGGARTDDAIELMYARQNVVLIAKAFRLQAVDLVHINFRDLEGLQRQSLEGARMGFTGKQIIHPSQVDVVQKAFLPTAEKVEWATELIKAFNEHQKSGKGAFTFHGNMIDMPLVLQARNITDLVENIYTSEA